MTGRSVSVVDGWVGAGEGGGERVDGSYRGSAGRVTAHPVLQGARRAVSQSHSGGFTLCPLPHNEASNRGALRTRLVGTLAVVSRTWSVAHG